MHLTTRAWLLGSRAPVCHIPALITRTLSTEAGDADDSQPAEAIPVRFRSAGKRTSLPAQLSNAAVQSGLCGIQKDCHMIHLQLRETPIL